MKMNRHPFHYFTLLLCCAIGLAGYGAVNTVNRPAHYPSALAIALARWHRNAPTSYRLQVDEQSLGEQCHQEVEIHSERIVAITENSCAHQPWTVTALFTRIEQDMQTAKLPLTACIVAGCACVRTPAFWASYDAQLGYPRERRTGIVLTDNWLHHDFWRLALWQRHIPNCNTTTTREMLTARVLPIPERVAGISRL